MPSLSADGRFVAFESSAPDGTSKVFLRDTCAGAVQLVPSTTLIAGSAGSPSLSSNGRYVSFVASASSAAAESLASSGSLFVYDTCFAAAAECSPQAYAIAAASVGSGASPLTATAHRLRLARTGPF